MQQQEPINVKQGTAILLAIAITLVLLGIANRVAKIWWPGLQIVSPVCMWLAIGWGVFGVKRRPAALPRGDAVDLLGGFRWVGIVLIWPYFLLRRRR